MFLTHISFALLVEVLFDEERSNRITLESVSQLYYSKK